MLQEVEIDWSDEALSALHILKTTNKNLFVTGKAGTGKSTLLHHIQKIFNKRSVVLAPTGIAALNVNGQTIHSFFGLKPGFELEEATHMNYASSGFDKFRKLELIILDEVSMVRADILDAMDIALKKSRKTNLPFGGVRVVLFGDLFQLPPVVTDEDLEVYSLRYDSAYFFAAKVFEAPDLFTQGFKFDLIELKKVYRQKDLDFIQALNGLRDASNVAPSLNFVNQSVEHSVLDEEHLVKLVSTNSLARQINSSELSKIAQETHSFEAYLRGKLLGIYPNDDKVHLKVGAQVMFLTNDAKKRWVNGSIGKVEEFFNVLNKDSGIEESMVKVLLDSGKEVNVGLHTWEISKYVFKGGRLEREVSGTFTQIPLKLAWAITIHKSQGKTFNHTFIDFGRGAFAHGQVYVALSRATSFKGVQLQKEIQDCDIIVDQEVKSFFEADFWRYN